MARKSSYVPLKQRKPKWYCINRPYGRVKSMITHRKPLYYVTDAREMKLVKKLLGNPSFFDNYDYLLVTRDDLGDFEEIYGVEAEIASNGISAFDGKVDRILFGWAQDKRHYDMIIDVDEITPGGCSTGDCDKTVADLDDLQ